MRRQTGFAVIGHALLPAALLAALGWTVRPSLAQRGAQQGAVPPDALITLYRGACEARCAVYTVSIAANGAVAFDGQHYVRVRGRSSARAAPDAVLALAQRFGAMGFFALEDEYSPRHPASCHQASDSAPRATTTLRWSGRTKTVVNDHRCGGPVAAALRELETAIDGVAGSVRWIR